MERLYEELSWSNEKFIAMLERLRVSGAAADFAADGRYPHTDAFWLPHARCRTLLLCFAATFVFTYSLNRVAYS